MTPADIDLESCLYSLIPSGRCSATNHLKEWAEALNPTVRNWAGILLKRARLQTRKPMRYGPVNTHLQHFQALPVCFFYSIFF